MIDFLPDTVGRMSGRGHQVFRPTASRFVMGSFWLMTMLRALVNGFPTINHKTTLVFVGVWRVIDPTVLLSF